MSLYRVWLWLIRATNGGWKWKGEISATEITWHKDYPKDDGNCMYIKKDRIKKNWKNKECTNEGLALCERRTTRELL